MYSQYECTKCLDLEVVPKWNGQTNLFDTVDCPRCVDPKCEHCGVKVPRYCACCASCADERGP